MQLKLSREPNEKKLIEEKQKIAAIKTFPVKTNIRTYFSDEGFGSILQQTLLQYIHTSDFRLQSKVNLEAGRVSPKTMS